MTMTSEPISRPLRSYQHDAVQAVLRQWESQRSVLLVIATGCGKTRIAAEICRLRASQGRILWLAHREELLEQAAESLRQDGRLTVDYEQADKKAFVFSLGCSSRVVVGSVQTLRGRRLERWPADSFSTIVVDEAHHATALGYRAILNRFSGASVLGLTATPDRGDGVGLGSVFESCAYQYDISDGISGGYLSSIRARRIVCDGLDLTRVRVRGGDIAPDDLEKAMKIEGVLHQIAAPLVEESGSRPTIVFTPTVSVAEELARVLSGYVGARRVASISAKTPKDTRAEILSQYKSGSIQYITNCAVLTEGFDAPTTACIAMCRPTKIRALVAQCIGRGTRLSPGKNDCLVLDFTGKTTMSLVGPEDVLAGKELTESERGYIHQRMSEVDPAELPDIIADAKEAAAKAEELKRLMNARAKITVLASYAKAEIDLFAPLAEVASIAQSTLRSDKKGPIATDKQRELLAKYGIEVPKTSSVSSARKTIDEIFRRDFPTYKQMRILSRSSLPTNVTKKSASQLIDRLAQSGWKAGPEIKALAMTLAKTSKSE